jgi:hypothetical protein
MFGWLVLSELGRVFVLFEWLFVALGSLMPLGIEPDEELGRWNTQRYHP